MIFGNADASWGRFYTISHSKALYSVVDTYLVYKGVVALLHNQKLIWIAPIWLRKEAFNDIEVVCNVCASSSPIRHKFWGKEPHLTLWHGNIRIYTSFIGQGNIQSFEKR